MTGKKNRYNYQQQTCKSKERTPRKMKTKTAVLNGKPDAGNPHVRFDEGEVASAKPRRGSLLYIIVDFRADVRGNLL